MNSPRPSPPGHSPARRLERAERAYATGFGAEAMEPHIRAVVRDTLATPGGLTRLQLALIAGEALQLPAAIAQPFATAVEYFHTASLLLDDLPCMDDAQLRRGRPCAHVAHGEGAAILGALGFINRAYRLVWEAISRVSTDQRAGAADHVERCLGAAGVLDGQSMDLHFAIAGGGPARAVARTALGKTVSLLRLTLVTPALLAGAPARERLLLDRICVAWGLAYQIADDFNDLSNSAGTGKSPGRDRERHRPNFVLVAGRAAATIRFRHLLRNLDVSSRELSQRRPGWRELSPLLTRLRTVAPQLPDELSASRCA